MTIVNGLEKNQMMKKQLAQHNKMLNYSYHHWKVMKKNKRKKRNKNLNSKQTVS